jgi:hypothetical protein
MSSSVIMENTFTKEAQRYSNYENIMLRISLGMLCSRNLNAELFPTCLDTFLRTYRVNAVRTSRKCREKLGVIKWLLCIIQRCWAEQNTMLSEVLLPTLPISTDSTCFFLLNMLPITLMHRVLANHSCQVPLTRIIFANSRSEI